MQFGCLTDEFLALVLFHIWCWIAYGQFVSSILWQGSAVVVAVISQFPRIARYLPFRPWVPDVFLSFYLAQVIITTCQLFTYPCRVKSTCSCRRLVRRYLRSVAGILFVGVARVHPILISILLIAVCLLICDWWLR